MKIQIIENSEDWNDLLTQTIWIFFMTTSMNYHRHQESELKWITKKN